MYRDILFCLLAARAGHIDEVTLRELARAAHHGSVGNPREDLIRRAGLDGAAEAAVEREVAAQVAAHGGDAAAALGSLCGEGSSDGTLSLVGWWAQHSVVTDPLPRPAAPGGQHDVEAVTPETAGRYALSGGSREAAEIGRGGLGRVLLAVDHHIGRQVAVKELLTAGDFSSLGSAPTTGSAPPGVARFLREARVTGQLEHPNIVPVYELGVRPDGTLYYTMRLVRGRTMAAALRSCQGLRDRLKLLSHFADVCHAVAFAHSRGVIHRDLKGENVMLGEFGETVVLDWGLAKVAGASDIREGDLRRSQELLVAAAAGVTLEGSVLGTPHHMSPEQASGALDEVDERTDVWALGTVLYEILTGRRAFIAASPLEVLHKVVHDAVTPPRQIEPAVPSELESVCLKALARAKGLRYASASELAHEVESWQSGEKVVAHEYTAWEHLRRFAAKQRTAIVAAAAVVAVVVGALVGLTSAWRSEKAAHRAETEQRQLASYNLAQAFSEKAARQGRACAWLSTGVLAAASVLHNPAASGAPRRDPGFAVRWPDSAGLSVEARSWGLEAAARAAVTHARTIVAGQPVCALAVSPDSALVAGAACDGPVWLWESSTGTTLRTVAGGSGGTTAVAFSPDGRTLAMATGGGEVRLLGVATGELTATLRGHEGAVSDVAFSADSKLVVSAGRDRTVIVWEAATGRRLRTLEGHGGGVHGVACAGAGLVATASRDAAVRLFDGRTGRLLRTVLGHTGVVRGVALSPDGTLVAGASYDRTARVWSVADGAVVFTAGPFEDEVMSVAFSPDGRWLAVAGWDRSVTLWETATGALLQRLEAHRAAVWKVAFAPDGSFLASASDDGTVWLWSLRRPAPALTTRDQGYVWAVAYSPDGTTVATGSDDRAARLWDDSGALRAVLSGHRDTVSAVAFSPDGATVATGSFDNTVRLWDAGSGRLLRALEGHANFVRSVGFSPDGRTLASGSYDQTVALWDVASGRRRVTITGYAARVRDVEFSPDGRVLASCGDEPVVRFHDPGSGALLGEARSDGERLVGLAFSGDGRLLATAGERGTVGLWDVAASRWLAPLRWDEQQLNAVAFSPDGLLLTACDARRVDVWSVAARRRLLTLPTSQSVIAVASSPDGRTLAVGDAATARLYPLRPDAVTGDPRTELERACRVSGLALDGFALVPASAAVQRPER